MILPLRKILIVGLLTLAGCSAGVGAPRPGATAAAAAPPAQQDAAAARFSLNAADSHLHILVYRDGPLARLGHNHVISATAMRGELALAQDPAKSTLEITLPLANLIVDDTAARARAGADFAADVNERDRDGTRANMLGDQLLNAAAFPDIVVQLARIDGALPAVTLIVDVSLGGARQRIGLPATVTLEDTRVTASGEAVVSHAQLGLTPFSVMLGALRVRDDITLRYSIAMDKS